MELTDSIHRLRKDHELICEELTILKNAQRDAGIPLRQVLREVCSRLSAGLLDHIRQEDRMGQSPPCDHYGDYRYLQVISQHIACEDRPFLLNSRLQLLTRFIQGLHRHMDVQGEESGGLSFEAEPAGVRDGARVVQI